MTSFLDYYKMILDKVSFNTQLLSKEYQKATRALNDDEIKVLNHWLELKGISNSLQYKNS